MRKYNKPTIEFLEINSVNNIASLSGTLASGNPYGDNATENITPVYQQGVVQRGASYFVCSDGLVHELEKEELKILLITYLLIKKN